MNTRWMEEADGEPSIQVEHEELKPAGTSPLAAANEEPETPGKKTPNEKTPSPPPSKKRRLPIQKTPANKKNPACRKAPTSRKATPETEKMTSQPRKKVTRSPQTPTLDRQPPTSISKMTLMKTTFTMESKTSSKPPP